MAQDPNNPVIPTVKKPIVKTNPAGGLPDATSSSAVSTVVNQPVIGVTNSTTLTLKDIIPVAPTSASGSWTTAYLDSSGAEKWAAVYSDPSSPTGYSITTDQAGYRQAVIQNLIGKYGSILNAKKALASVAGGLGGTTAKAKASIAAGNGSDPVFEATVDSLIGTASRTNFYSNGVNTTNAVSLIDGRPNYAGTRQSITVNYTSKDAAWTDLDKFMENTLGRHASLDEFNNYYKQLNAYEKTHPINATVTMDGLGVERNRVETAGPSADDKMMVLVSAVTPSLMAAGKDPSAISKTGGQLAQNMLALQQRAAQMGVSDYYDQTKAFEAAVNSIQPGNTLQGEAAKIDNLAISLPKYKGIASSLTAGFTVQDMLKPYNDKLNTILETSNPVDFANPYLQKALTGGPNGGQMNDDQFAQLVKSDPTWRNTQNAREQASQYLNQIGQMMGFTG